MAAVALRAASARGWRPTFKLLVPPGHVTTFKLLLEIWRTFKLPPDQGCDRHATPEQESLAWSPRRRPDPTIHAIQVLAHERRARPCRLMQAMHFEQVVAQDEVL